METPHPEDKLFIYGREVEALDAGLVEEIRVSIDPEGAKESTFIDGFTYGDYEGKHLEIVAIHPIGKEILKSLGLHPLDKRHSLFEAESAKRERNARQNVAEAIQNIDPTSDFLQAA